MATYKILYWQEIPAQIKAEDDSDDVTVQMVMTAPSRSRTLICAAPCGLQGPDEYLAQWKWSEEEDRPGSAEEVAEAVRTELEAKADW